MLASTFAMRLPLVGGALLILAGGLALSIGLMLSFKSGPLLIGFSMLWAIAAAIAGARLRSWWMIGCPGLMLVVVLLWQAIFGRFSWASTYVFMLGVVFAICAAMGVVPGVWFGKRRQAGANARANLPT